MKINRLDKAKLALGSIPSDEVGRAAWISFRGENESICLYRNPTNLGPRGQYGSKIAQGLLRDYPYSVSLAC